MNSVTDLYNQRMYDNFFFFGFTFKEINAVGHGKKFHGSTPSSSPINCLHSSSSVYSTQSSSCSVHRHVGSESNVTFASSKCFGLVDICWRGPKGSTAVGREKETSKVPPFMGLLSVPSV